MCYCVSPVKTEKGGELDRERTRIVFVLERGEQDVSNNIGRFTRLEEVCPEALIINVGRAESGGSPCSSRLSARAAYLL